MSTTPIPLERRLAAALQDPDGALEILDKADCEASLAFFIKRFWTVLEPAVPMVWNWHLDAVGEHLGAVTDGQINRLLINLPPGMMKSLILVFWTAWEWGPRNMPYIRLVNFAYASSLTIRDNRKLRRLIGSDLYQKWWGDRVQISPDRDNMNVFELTRGGFSLATSVGGVGTGERGDRVKVDDPHNVRESESESVRSMTVEWFAESLTTRMNDPRNSSIIVIMQRVHESDISGHILKNDLGYQHLMLPMRFEKARACHTSLPRKGIEPIYARYLGTKQMWLEEGWKPKSDKEIPLQAEYRVARTQEVWPQDRRTEDDALLSPERFTMEVVVRDGRAMGPYAEAGQFQQRPSPRGGLLFKREKFAIVDTVPQGCIWVRHWDLAATKARVLGRGARTAGVLLGLTPSKRYIIADCATFQVDDPRPDIRRVSGQDAVQYGRVHISIPQDPGAGGKVSARDYVQMLAGYDVASQPEKGDKLGRAEPMAAQCNGGNVDLLRGSWNGEFLDEVSKFPTGNRKDIVDSMSGGFEYLLTRPVGEAFTAGVSGQG